MLSGAKSLAVAPPPTRARGVTSDLSIDEALLLHGAGWEPVDLVCGVSVVSVPVGVWNWGQGEITVASVAHNAAVKGASDQLRDECLKVHGYGVVGVRVEVEVRTAPYRRRTGRDGGTPDGRQGPHRQRRSYPTFQPVTSPCSKAPAGCRWAWRSGPVLPTRPADRPGT